LRGAAVLAAGAAIAIVLAAVAVFPGGGRAEAPSGGDAHRVAIRIASAGPRPAASRREAAAHDEMNRIFERGGLRVEVQGFTVRGRGRSRNVIGVLETPHRCLRIVMAHTDSTPNAPGANDNASGLGVLAALSRGLEELRPSCDVWLVATGAEERVYTGSPDHLGALALARLVRRRGLHRRLRWALSLDEVGRDRPFWLRSPVRRPRRRVEGELLGAARGANSPTRWVRDGGTGNSDHREFQLLGMPGAKLGVGAGGEPCRHRPCDRPSRLRRASLAAAQRLVERALR
jgi:hypothetical protein